MELEYEILPSFSEIKLNQTTPLKKLMNIYP